MFDVLKETLISEKELTEMNSEKLGTLAYIKSNLIYRDSNMYLTVDSLIEINNIITGANSITLQKVNVMSCGFDKTYMNKDLTENKLYLK